MKRIYVLEFLFGGEASMEVHAGTDLQPFNSCYHSEQACMEALIPSNDPEPICTSTKYVLLPSLSVSLLPDQTG